MESQILHKLSLYFILIFFSVIWIIKYTPYLKYRKFFHTSFGLLVLTCGILASVYEGLYYHDPEFYGLAGFLIVFSIYVSFCMKK